MLENFSITASDGAKSLTDQFTMTPNADGLVSFELKMESGGLLNNPRRINGMDSYMI